MDTVTLDLTDNRAIAPEKVAEVRSALGVERRSGTDRRGTTRGGRRAIDRMAPTPAEIDRFSRGLDEYRDEDHRDWEEHLDD